ncbi:hypothetical protein GCM10022276_12530 [Sphingomonas limnosediminicola]|uniref:Uncharacterized protein n=1 Tax=Sphingomonas limnosediminicola TaxID=940133 RepID=A0ABP7L4M6_9SPHN
MFRIVSMNQDNEDPTLTAVVVKPTQPIIESKEREGVAVPVDYAGMLVFRVVNDRLSLIETAIGEGSNRHLASPAVSGFYDLLRCRD